LKKLKIYLDTSVIGGCFDDEFEVFSNQLMDEIKKETKIGVISDVVVREMEYAPEIVKNHFRKYISLFEILVTSEESKLLADEYVKEKIVTEIHFNDASHISLATVNNIDILCSWNFKHLVNYDRIARYNSVNIKLGYKPLAIYSPREVIEIDETEEI
jgi:hypothetical protein